MPNISHPPEERPDEISGNAAGSSHVRSRIQNQIQNSAPGNRFIFLVSSSLFLSCTLLKLISPQNVGYLAGIDPDSQGWWEAGRIIAWRVVDLGLAWLVGFDGWDVTELTVLTHVPVYFLMLNFYNVRPTVVATAFLIEVISKTVPFAILRGPNSVHALSAPRATGISNIGILQDRVTALSTAVAAAATYTIVLFLGFSTWLPVHLVLHFEGIPDIRLVHSGLQGLPSVFLQVALAGYAAYDLLFVGSAGWANNNSTAGKVYEDRDGEYLITSLYNRTWGKLRTKGKILVSRTFIVALMTLGNTIVQVSGTVEGVDLLGSVGWGALWATAVLAVGGLFAWIEAVPGV
ncbi:hypothetical protein PISL3812_02913 [Talaromyces islandicus]|uniref:Uncharacterized protein n=1 Tax=Talaromyces islandicus TaxID=28573 RepID=A0A0U1LTJ1_TALIS|nr:hypothetical protein PISL3812_02913 [Talaromyces islandicus]